MRKPWVWAKMLSGSGDGARAALAALAGQPERLRAEVERRLSDQPRPGCPGEFTPEQICQLIALACETPPLPLTHWTRRDLARASVARGIGPSISASRIGRFLKSGRSQTPSHP